jgi:nucleoside-diphosphate-sugar epimerase
MSDAPRGTVLVTGAGGFLGTHLVPALAGTGWKVRALTRNRPVEARAGVEVLRGALEDGDVIARAVEGADAVVHLAARVHVMRDTAADPLAEFRRVNVEGTRALLQAAADAGVRRFVLASSVKAVGESTSASEPWTDDTRPDPSDPYGVSKREAEVLVRELGARLGVHTTALRFPLVYGPGVGANMLQLFSLVARGVPLPLASVANRRSMVYAGNAAAAVAAVLDAGHPSGETFFVADTEAGSTAGLVRGIAAALGKRPRLVAFPPTLLRVLGRLGGARGTAIVDRLTGSLAVDASRLTRLTGFHPPYSQSEGLAATAGWYRARNG